MPRYDFACSDGHVHEAIARRDEKTMTCPTCGRSAVRQLAVGIGIGGFQPMPTSEHKIPVTRAMDALDGLQNAARREGINLPNPYQVAKDRIARGEVKAIK